MKTRLLLLLTLVFLSLTSPAQTCSSSLTSQGWAFDGANYHFYLQLCTGGGRTGIFTGGSQNTGSFAFGFFFPVASGGLVTSWPTTICPGTLAAATTCYTTVGAQCPPTPNPFNLDCWIRYNPVTPGAWFTCVSSTVDCGDTLVYCQNLEFVTNTCPDSIIVYGLEGANIATNGCYASSYDSIIVRDPCSGPALTSMLTGSVYQDLNSNCIRDLGEPGLAGREIRVPGYTSTWTTFDGWYYIFVDSGSYSLTCMVDPMLHVLCPSTDTITVTVADFDTLIGLDFAVIDSANHLLGRAYIDWDSSSTYDPGIDSLLRFVTMTDAYSSGTASTGTTGQYDLRRGPGFYTVETTASLASPWHLQLEVPASGTYTITFPGLNDTIAGLDFAWKYVGPDTCAIPALTTYTVPYKWKVCDTMQVHISMFNTTPWLSTDSLHLEIIIDDSLDFVDWGTLPPGTISGDTLRTTVPPSALSAYGAYCVYCSSPWYFNAAVPCSPTLVDRWSRIRVNWPRPACDPAPAGWDGSTVEVTSSCVNCLTFTNTAAPGVGDMAGYTYYTITVAGGLAAVDSLMLCGGCDTTICFPYISGWAYATVDQRPFHPSIERWNTFLDACIPFAAHPVDYPTYIPGSITYASRTVRQIVSSFDPNSKTAFPQGTGPDHHIAGDEEIEYTLHFQNTGTAPALHVYLRDTLSTYLNPLTIAVGASSHPYTWSLSASGALEFAFVGINLPDSTTDPEGSQGFITYRIHPDTGLVAGTVINNSAGIYFDCNPPVATNTVFHTIFDPVDPCTTLAPIVTTTDVDEVNFSIITPVPGDSVVVDFGDGTSATLDGTMGLDSLTHTYVTTGTYMPCITFHNFCGTSTVCDTVSVIVTDQLMPLGGSVSVYPNPFTDAVTFDLTGMGTSLTLDWIDLTGRTLRSYPISGDGRNTFPRTGLPAGVYIWRITRSGTLLTKGRMMIN